MYPSETREMQYQMKQQVMYRYVLSTHTGTYHFMTLKYILGTYCYPQIYTRKHIFNIVVYLLHTGTLAYWYILEVKRMYLEHT